MRIAEPSTSRYGVPPPVSAGVGHQEMIDILYTLTYAFVQKERSYDYRNLE